MADVQLVYNGFALQLILFRDLDNANVSKFLN